MNYNEIGKTGITISEIGLGCWTLGGLNWENSRFSSGWVPVDPADAESAIHYALDNGVTHFDTADVYVNGAAERLLADSIGDKNKKVIISSKVGWFSGTALHAYEPDHIKHQCEQSLINLKRDCIDIYYFHHGNFGENDCYLDDACCMMQRLKSEGKIRCIGLSAYSEKDFKRLIPKITPSVVQAWAHLMDYHFIAPDSPLMNLCKQYSISFIGFSPLNQGILSGKYNCSSIPEFISGDHREKSEKFREPYLKKAMSILDQLKELFGDTQEELIRIALQFVLYHKNIAGVIPGFRNLEQVKMNLSAAGKPLNGKDIALIRELVR